MKQKDEYAVQLFDSGFMGARAMATKGKPFDYTFDIAGEYPNISYVAVRHGSKIHCCLVFLNWLSSKFKIEVNL